MLDLFPSARATLKAATYFATTLSGFSESSVFLVFKENEAPQLYDRFITIGQQAGNQHRHTDWSSPYLTFSTWVNNDDWDFAWTTANEIREIFKALRCFAAVGESDPIQYELMGDAIYDDGHDPVTEKVQVSLSLRFGITE